MLDFTIALAIGFVIGFILGYGVRAHDGGLTFFETLARPTPRPTAPPGDAAARLPICDPPPAASTCCQLLLCQAARNNTVARVD
jgi:hypothetical protein